jgi:D-serine deaminase-like pyridoxal phosphate-dependent protein
MRVHDLPTPALIIDANVMASNLAIMADTLPGPRLRPHVKAHKMTALASQQVEQGHRGFTCATPAEVLGLAEASLGDDILLANETVDAQRLSAMARCKGNVTVAVDSPETIAAAASCGIEQVVIDVAVGLARCGVEPADAGRLAELASASHLTVRGVMGYEGHLVALPDEHERREKVAESMELLLAAHRDVGGDLISAGGTGTYAVNTAATEIQAGSYVLMDSAYGGLTDLPFAQALFVDATVISVAKKWAVADAGLKALAMDHGDSHTESGSTWFFSDEHLTYGPNKPTNVGDRIRIVPAHIDPTIAKHPYASLVDGDEVVEQWPIDLRYW